MDNVEIYLNEAILFASEYSELYNESAGDIGDSIIECLTKAVHMVQSFLQKVIDVINNNECVAIEYKFSNNITEWLNPTPG